VHVDRARGGHGEITTWLVYYCQHNVRRATGFEPVNADLVVRMEDAIADYAARERAWLPHDQRGRWVVIEPGAGRHLSKSPKAVRQIADRASKRRARRFSSLSRARAFAREVGGTVARWRRTPPDGGIWIRETIWQRALATQSTRFSLANLMTGEI
jgi:hypothetical protein